MIITENVTINDVQYKYTKSSLGYYIQRNDGKQFIDAYDKIDSTFTYIELTSSPKPITVQNINFSQLYPIGSIYIGTMAVCPLEVLGIGTWELKSKGRVLQGANTETPGTTKEAGLPDHYHYVFNSTVTDKGKTVQNFLTNSNYASSANRGGGGYEATCIGETTNVPNVGRSSNASVSNSIYGKSTTVQPPAYIVNIWERIS